MVRAALLAASLLALGWASFGAGIAHAEGGSPSASASPSASPSSPAPSSSPSPSPSGTVAPTLPPPPRPPPAPGRTGSSSPAAPASPTPASPTPGALGAPAANDPLGLPAGPSDAEIEAARSLIAATSLADRLAAQGRLAAAERSFLIERQAGVRAERAATARRIAELDARRGDRAALLERLLQETYRATRTNALSVFLTSGSLVETLLYRDALAALAAQQQAVTEELRRIADEVRRQEDGLARQESELAMLLESVGAKERLLVVLQQRADALVAVAPTDRAAAEIDVLTQLAQEAAEASSVSDELIARAATVANTPLPRQVSWAWPVRGIVSQPFGPTLLPLEPRRTYGGIPYPHFHDAIDIAAPLRAPVTAAAAGLVTFVGHLPDGAMVVVIAHAGGLVTLYAHLDDTLAAPTVRAGDTVAAGDRIGAIGMTGLTTGPHLHFAVRRGEVPLDPRTLLPDIP